MNSNFQVYRDAARKLSRNWSRGDFTDDHGGECLVEGVRTSAGLYSRNLPDEIVSEIDAKLDKFWRYRLLRTVGAMRGTPTQAAIMVWNDTGRQATVVKALNELADEQEIRWLREERIRLMFEIKVLTERIDGMQTEIDNLHAQVAELKTSIANFKTENGLLRRMTNSATLRADRAQLQEIEEELSITWNALMSGRDVLTAKTTELNGLTI